MAKKFNYVEHDNGGNAYRTEYYNSINKLLQKKQKQAIKNRDEFGPKILLEPEKYREEFKKMLGWPLTEEPVPYKNVKTEFVTSEENCDIYRMQFEIFDDFWFYGMLFKKKSDKPLPLVIAQHGGQGAPEMVAGFFNPGNYNQMINRIIEQDVHVFAPQLLLWQEDRLGPATCRGDVDHSLKQLGSTITALEIYCISRCLDYFEKQEYTVNSFGMIGLSYGGFYTYFTAAVDTRIKAAFTCSQFNDRYRYNWGDWVFWNAANTFFDAEVGALIYPRPLFIEVGDRDPLFDVLFAKEEFKRLEKLYSGKPENLRFRIFGGDHEFSPSDDEAIKFVTDNLI